MRIQFLLLVFGTIALVALVRILSQAESVYLFDCQGRILRMEAPDFSLRSLTHVTRVDPTLPDRVRDGCAIHDGWYDDARDRLVLVVQTRAWQDENDSLPTKLLELTGLAPVAQDSVSPPPARSSRLDRQDVASRLASLPGPFAQSQAYVLPDGVTALLQEVTPTGAAARPLTLDTGWEAGAIGLRQATSRATGRYALFDLTTGTQRGAMVSAVDGAAEQRVICFSPRGLVLLTMTRGALLVLNVADPGHKLVISDIPLDLYWTACAWT